MAGFKLEFFKGMRPRISSTKLPIGEATSAENTALGSGDLEPWLDKSTEQAVTAGRNTRTIYLYDNGGTPVWLEWDDVVDVVAGPVKGDTIERVYYTGDSAGDGKPKLTTTDLVGTVAPYPGDWTYLGIPAPASPLVAVAPDLPEDVPSGDRFTNIIVTDEFLIDRVEWTVYPETTGTPDTIWNYSSTGGVIEFRTEVGSSFRVTEVVNANKVKLESASDPGVFMRTANSDKTTVKDWKATDNNGSDQAADFIGWSIPTGAEATIVGHKLLLGDVITVTASSLPITYYGVAGDDMYEQEWATPSVVIEDGGGSHYEIQNARISPTAVSGGATFLTYGNFFYDVDRVASVSDSLELRTYVYTYVSSLGEEGPPSEPSNSVNALDGASVDLTALELPPTVGFDIETIRIYRTNSTEAGTEYQFVKWINVSTVGGFDTVPAAELGEVIASTSWDPPNPNMTGLIELPNGMMAGFYGKNIYFCEPYFPHAWPAEYDQVVGHTIVGLASFGNSIAILTDGLPSIATGSHPRNMNIRQTKINQACVSKQSIASDDDKVFYASPDGIVEISVNGIRLATDEILTQKNWAAYNPATMVGEFHEGLYYGFHDFDATFIDPQPGAEVSGTITAALEENIVSGVIAEGDVTVILTLSNDIWVAEGTSFDNQRQNLIDGLTSASTQTLGWNALVRDIALTVTDVVRTSDTVVTITVPAVTGYSVTSSETVVATVPAAAVSVSNIDLVTQGFTITAQFPIAQVSLGGTLAGTGEGNVRTGGFTVTLTIVDDTWVENDSPSFEFDSIRQLLIDSVTATTDETSGWNDTVPNEIALTDVVRTSDTVVTFTLPAVPLYEITVTENIEAIIPSTALQVSSVDATALNSIAIIGSVAVPIALFSGDIETALESDIVSGARQIVITLTNDTWIAAGTGPIGTTAESDALIAALIATTSQTLGWNNVVVPGIETADLVRTSTTVATITLDAESTYSISSSETIGMTIPGASLTAAGAVIVSNTFGVTSQDPVTCTVSGTVTLSSTVSGDIEEDGIIPGGKTLILTLYSDTWKVAGTGPIGTTVESQDLVDGITSAQVEATGWNTLIRDVIDPSIIAAEVIRTNDTVVTITLPAAPTYAITASEVITVTVPASAITVSPSPVIASPTIGIDQEIPTTAVITGTVLTAFTADDVRTGGRVITITVDDDELVDSGATFNAQRQAIINGITSATTPTNGWNNEVRDTTLIRSNVVRTNNTTITVTLPATPLFTGAANEVITVTVPASALIQSDIAVIATPTFSVSATLQTFVMGGIKPQATVHGPYVCYSDSTLNDWDETEVDIVDNATRTIGAIAYSSTSSAWVYATSGIDGTNDVWRSTDDGANWTQVYTGIAYTLGESPNIYWHPDHDTFVAGFNAGDFDTGRGLLYSEDGGVTWVRRVRTANETTMNASQMVWGGTNYVYQQPRAFASSGGWAARFLRSANLSTGSLANEFTEFDLNFGLGANSQQTGTTYVMATGNGMHLCIATEHPIFDPYSEVYTWRVSTLPLGTTTGESYIGEVLLDALLPTKLFYTGTHWVATALQTGGFPLAYDLPYFGGSFYGGSLAAFKILPTGSEAVIGDWEAGIATPELIGTYVSDVFFDPGAPGQVGLGFVVVGRDESGKGVIWTAPDETFEFTKSETLTLESSRIMTMASKYIVGLS